MAGRPFAPSSAAWMREGIATVVPAIAATTCAPAAENYAERGSTGYEGHGRRTFHSQLLCIGVGSELSPPTEAVACQHGRMTSDVVVVCASPSGRT